MVLSLALRSYPSGILYPGGSKFHSRGDKMCLGCFNPLILHKDYFEGGSDPPLRSRGRRPDPTQLHGLFRRRRGGNRVRLKRPGRSGGRSSGAEVIFKGGKIIRFLAPRQ